MYRNLLLSLLFVVGWVSAVEAQTQPEPPQENAPASESTHAAPAPALTGGYLLPEGQDQGVDATWTSLHPIVPAVFGGYRSSLIFGEEMERSNFVRGGVTLQGMYDDNPYALNGGDTVGNYSVSIFPQISLDQSRSRLRWLLDYAGGFTFNQRLTNENQTSQNLSFDLQYRVSPHVNVRASEYVSLTSGLFGPINSLSGTAPGVPEGSNNFVLTPLARTFTTTTRGEVTYQFSQTDIVGATGGFNSLQYSDVTPGTSLLNNRTETATGYYMHRMTPKDWLGGAYWFQHFGYPDSVDNTLVHSIIAFDTYAISPAITLSIYGGGQHSNNQFPGTSSVSLSSLPLLNGPFAALATTTTQVGTQTQWSPAGGVDLSWTGLHSSASVGFAHVLSDGGGLQGTVELTSVVGSFRHQFTRRTSVTFSGSYGKNDELAPASAAGGISSATYASGGVSVTRRLGSNYYIQAGYTRQSQQTTGLSTFGNDVQRDLVMASFSYQFAKPWGQ